MSAQNTLHIIHDLYRKLYDYKSYHVPVNKRMLLMNSIIYVLTCISMNYNYGTVYILHMPKLVDAIIIIVI